MASTAYNPGRAAVEAFACARPDEEQTHVSNQRTREKKRPFGRSTREPGAPRSNRMWTMLTIALGAAVGANLRYALSLWAARQWGATFPYGTLLINVSGSFAIGVV